MSEDLRRFNRFPPKGIFLPSILDIYSKMKILLEAVRWLKRLQTIRAPLAPAAGSFIPAKCVMRLENTFCCFPSPQCMLPALFCSVDCYSRVTQVFQIRLQTS